ncbi:unnamed protein product [Paramecium primaurelia]|uniref:Uncharacterized protein n=1 Tax=Paramecium primaurelia TaxID=5886 RepID=A0A8S1QKH5_PARPR|nr:unnamed protein product [Paramecium primaurelia]
MFANQDCFEVYEKTQEVRQAFSEFKQNVIIQLGKLEFQIETIIFEQFEQSQTNQIDQIYDNKIDNDNSQYIDDETQELVSIWNKANAQQNEEQIPKYNDQLVKRIKKTFTLWEQQIKELLQIDLQIIPRYSSLKYRFDNNAKFPSIKIIEERIIEQTQTQTHYCFALVEQRLNQIETSSIQFKFPKFVGDIGVGICDKKILKSKDFRPFLNALNNGAFVCFQDSYVINTEQEELNWKTKGFKFFENEVIEVTYEPSLKRVIWKKVLKPNEGYSVVLRNHKRELYFCCIVKTQGAKVEIITE